MKIVSIDIGTRNLGLCVYVNKKLTHFDCYDLFDYVKKKERTDYSLMVINFIRENHNIFSDLDVILLENQMQSRMKIIMTTFRVFFWGKSVRISPLAVHNFFRTGNKGKHKENKKSAIKLVGQFLNKRQVEKITKHKKKDDISDSIIQVHYYLGRGKIKKK